MKCMMVYTAKWKEVDTFKMYPVNNECPFQEVIYDPDTKVLVLISKTSKPTFQMLPKLNTNGDLILVKNEKYAQERVLVPTYYEYYIDNFEDIHAFITMFVVNSTHQMLNILNA
jgi:hypothetical protein